MINGHGGNIFSLSKTLGVKPEEISDFSSNINPNGPMDGLIDYLKNEIFSVIRLPEADATSINTLFAEYNGISPRHVLSANGTTQFIYTIPLALSIREALVLIPTYADYEDALRLYGSRIDYLIGDEKDNYRHPLSRLMDISGAYDAVFICNPNNPTGQLIEKNFIMMLLQRHPRTIFIIDESYLPFVAEGEDRSLIGESFSNLIVLSSMSKIFRIPGLRIGFISAAVPLIERIVSYLMPWSVNAIAQAALSFIYQHGNETRKFIRNSSIYLRNEKDRFLKASEREIPIEWIQSSTPFFLGKLPAGITDRGIGTFLEKQKILIRKCANFRGLSDHYIRISIKTGPENDRLLQKLSLFFEKGTAQQAKEDIHELSY